MGAEMNTVYLNNDYDIQGDLTKLGDAGIPVAAPGEVGIGFFAETKGGAAIHADLSKPLVARLGLVNRYYATFDGELLTLRLSTFVDLVIWQCVRFNNDLEKWSRVRVRATR